MKLCPLGPEHAEALFPLVHGTGVTGTLLWDGPSSLEELKAGYAARQQQMAKGELHAFAIELEGRPVGSISLRPVAPAFRWDIGLWIGAPYQGRGLGTRAIGEVLALAFERLGLQKVEAAVFVGNAASRRAFEKNGMALEGTVRCAVKKGERFVDEWILGITRQDYAKSRRAGAGAPP